MPISFNMCYIVCQSSISTNQSITLNTFALSFICILTAPHSTRVGTTASGAPCARKSRNGVSTTFPCLGLLYNIFPTQLKLSHPRHQTITKKLTLLQMRLDCKTLVKLILIHSSHSQSPARHPLDLLDSAKGLQAGV